jgi:hypothetical protein
LLAAGMNGWTLWRHEGKERKKRKKEGATIAMHASPNCPVGLCIGYVPNGYNRRVSFPVITNGQALGTVNFRRVGEGTFDIALGKEEGSYTTFLRVKGTLCLRVRGTLCL